MNVFSLYQSNKMEELAAHLSRVMEEDRRKDFSLSPDVVLVNNYEMGQWLSVALAEKTGICANIRFSLLGSFIWDLALDALETEPGQVMTRQKVRWAIFQCLKEMTSTGQAHLELSSYEKGRGEEGLFHLSGRLEVIFDRYLNHRYLMLEEWEAGKVPKESPWQRDLWLSLCSRFGDRFKTKQIRSLLEGLVSGKEVWEKVSGSLSKRLYVFGVSYLTPLHLEILTALSRRIKVHMFMLNPCKKYWADIVPKKFRERARALGHFNDQEIDSLFPEGNPLLASLGKAGRSFLFRLYNTDFHDPSDDLFVENVTKAAPSSMLHRVQDDILNLIGPGFSAESPDASCQSEKIKIGPEDESILVNSCYSRLREVEALHNYLVRLFDSIPDLDPREVAVLAPNMGDYGPYIHAVFGAAPEERSIPYQLADIGLVDENPVYSAYSMLFSMGLSELTAPAVADLLEHPVIMERRGLDQKAVERIKDWIDKSGARRGFDTLSKKVTEYQNTWLFGLDRLFATASMEGIGPGQTGIEPVDELIEGDAFSWLGELSSVIHDLWEFSLKAQSATHEGMEVNKWRRLALDLVERFISDSPYEDDSCLPLVEKINSLFDTMEDAGVGQVSYPVVNRAIQQLLGGTGVQHSFISGKVLCASLIPMRSLPFRVICLLGMDDSSFPRTEQPPSFDLMAKTWHPGDRNPRDEDRYLFLETIISARERLWISYIGRREEDDSIQNPSSVVSELLDYLQARFEPTDLPSIEEKVVIEHPLQPFSRKYLLETQKSCKNFALEWLPVDKNGNLIKQSRPKPLVGHGDTVRIPGEILEALRAQSPWSFAMAFTNPGRWYLENILGVYLERTEESLKDHEPFSIEADLDSMLLKELLSPEREWLKQILEGEKVPDRWIKRLRGQGLIPVGSYGDMLLKARFIEIVQKYFRLLKKVQKTAIPSEPVSRELTLGRDATSSVMVSGTIGRLGEHGGLFDILLSPKPFCKVSFWIKHLLYCASLDHDVKGAKATILCPKTDVEYRPLDSASASELLDELAELFLLGILEGPLPLPCKSAYEYVKLLKPASKRSKGSTPEKAKEKLIGKAVSGKGFDRGDKWFTFIMRDKWTSALKSLLEHPDFHNHAMRLYEPLFEHMLRGR